MYCDIMTCMFMCGRFLSEVVFAYDAKFALNPIKNKKFTTFKLFTTEK